MSTQPVTRPPALVSAGEPEGPTPPTHVREPAGPRDDKRSPHDRAHGAAQEAARAAVAAQEAAQEARRTHAAAEKAQRDAEHEQRDLERLEERWAQNAGNEVRKLRAALEQLTAGKVAPPDVTPQERGYARAYLHGAGVGAGEAVEVRHHLARSDAFLARLLGIGQAAQMGQRSAAEHDSGELGAALDQLECRSWRAALRRIIEIAGEAEEV